MTTTGDTATQKAPDERGDGGAIDPAAPSLVDDIASLLEDGQTYVEAELAFQKTRLSFAAGQSKSGAVFLLGALAFVHLALIALVVGLVLSLAPLLTPLGATLALTGGLLLGALVLALAARRRFGDLANAFKSERP